jgi:hypothetical protein
VNFLSTFLSIVAGLVATMARSIADVYCGVGMVVCEHYELRIVKPHAAKQLGLYTDSLGYKQGKLRSRLFALANFVASSV